LQEDCASTRHGQELTSELGTRQSKQGTSRNHGAALDIAHLRHRKL